MMRKVIQHEHLSTSRDQDLISSLFQFLIKFIFHSIDGKNFINVESQWSFEGLKERRQDRQ